MSQQLLNVFDDRMLAKIYQFAKENKPRDIGIVDFITEDGRLEVMKLVVDNIPVTVQFTGNDLLTYMAYVNNIVGNTNSYKRYLANKNRR